MDWNKRDNDGWTPLHWALSWGHSNIVDIIVQQPNIDYDVKTEAGSTLAQAAVLGGNVKSVKTLTGEATFDCWNVPNSNGDTPVMTALERNMTDLVEILLRCPRIDIHTMKPEEGTSLVKELLWTCPSLQLRMIHEDSCLSRGWQDGRAHSEGSCQGRRGGEPRHRQYPGEGAQLPGGQAGKGHHQAGRGTAAGIVCGENLLNHSVENFKD